MQEKKIVRLGLTIIILIALLGLVSTPALAKGKGRYNKRACSKTASSAYLACQHDIKDDYWIAIGNCKNLEDSEEREDCLGEAKEEFNDAKDLCKEQFEARREVCELVGEEPEFDSENFKPFPISDGELNPYFPLEVGNNWVYRGTSIDDGEAVYEKDTVEVMRATKLIAGVNCIVVNDVVEECDEDFEECTVIEDTDDWYAQHEETNDVWYFGEIARNFETFEGDRPSVPELVDIDGSWKAGRDYATPGILIGENPQPGDAYRQEFALGEAEDVAEVLSNAYVFGDGDYDDPESLDYRVPGGLANALCTTGDPCVVTRELSALEPGVEERKYYAPGIGVFLEVNLQTGETVELVECNVDIKCGSLP